MQASYGPLDWLPVADGTIRRFHVPGDKAGTLNGWYVLHLDGIASGAFGSWKAGGSHTWSSRKPADPFEADLIARRIEQARRQREAEQHQRQQAAAIEAQRQWDAGAPADPRHPYLIAKGCQPHGLRQLGGVLLIPLYQGRQLVNLQRIYPDSTKRFMPGGRVRRCAVSARLPTPWPTAVSPYGCAASWRESARQRFATPTPPPLPSW